MHKCFLSQVLVITVNISSEVSDYGLLIQPLAVTTQSITQSEHWIGVDVTMVSRFRPNLLQSIAIRRGIISVRYHSALHAAYIISGSKLKIASIQFVIENKNLKCQPSKTATHGVPPMTAPLNLKVEAPKTLHIHRE